MDEALWSFYDNEANKVNPAANLSGLVIDCGSVAVYKTLFMTGTTACKDGLHYDSEVTLDMMDFELWIIAQQFFQMLSVKVGHCFGFLRVYWVRSVVYI